MKLVPSVSQRTDHILQPVLVRFRDEARASRVGSGQRKGVCRPGFLRNRHRRDDGCPSFKRRKRRGVLPPTLSRTQRQTGLWVTVLNPVNCGHALDHDTPRGPNLFMTCYPGKSFCHTCISLADLSTCCFIAPVPSPSQLNLMPDSTSITVTASPSRAALFAYTTVLRTPFQFPGSECNPSTMLASPILCYPTPSYPLYIPTKRCCTGYDSGMAEHRYNGCKGNLALTFLHPMGFHMEIWKPTIECLPQGWNQRGSDVRSLRLTVPAMERQPYSMADC